MEAEEEINYSKRMGEQENSDRLNGIEGIVSFDTFFTICFNNYDHDDYYYYQ